MSSQLYFNNQIYKKKKNKKLSTLTDFLRPHLLTYCKLATRIVTNPIKKIL